MNNNFSVLFLDSRPIRRGAQVFFHELKQRFAKDGIPVKRIFLYEEKKYEQLPLDEHDYVMPFWENHIFEKVPTVHPLLVLRLAKEIKSFSPDIILCNGSRTLKYAAVLKYCYSGIKSKWVYRVIDSAVYWNKKSITQLYYRYFVIPAMDGAVGVSQKSLDEMIKHYRFKKPSVSIPRAIDIDYFSKYVLGENARDKIGISKEAFVLLFLGNFTNQKRPDRFLNIIKGLQQEIPLIHGLMVGDGPLKFELEEQAKHLGIQNILTITGYQNNVRPWISISNVLLLTSDTEGMPGVVLEAGAMKKSTISNDVGGIREIISDCENGFIVLKGDEKEFKSKILDLYNSEELRSKFEITIFDTVFSRNRIEEICSRYLNFLNKIIFGT